MMLRNLLALCAILLATSATARAQVTVITSSNGEVVFQGGDDEIIQDTPTPSDTPTAEAKKPTGPRFEKLKKLDFDRRASAILAAWSKSPKADDKPAGEADKTAAEGPKTGEVAAPSAQAGVIVRVGTLQPGVTLQPAVPAQPSGSGWSTTTPTTPAGSTAQPTAPAQPAVPAQPSTTAQTGATTPAGTTPPAAGTATGAEATAETPEDPQKKKESEEAARKKAEQAEAKKKKAEEEAAKKAAEAKALEAELAKFQRDVTLGDWPAVKTYLASLTDDEKKVAYERLLQSLQKGPEKKPSVPPQGQAFLEKNQFSSPDVVALADVAPLPLTKENLAVIGQILRQALDQGHQMEGYLALVRPRLEIAASEPDHLLNRRQLSLVLSAANEQLFLGEFIPTAEEAETKGDREGLNLVSRYCLAQFEKDKKTSWLEQAWRATQAVLAAGEVSEDDKKEALTRAVDIAPKIQKELGQAWLDESFTQRPERGMEILSAIGTKASTALQMLPQDADKRFKLLELQTTAAKALLNAAPERATEWKGELEVLGSNWLREALVSYQYDDSTSLGPRMQRDNYGNFYYYDMGQQYRGNGPKAIRTGQVLEIRPGDDWLSRIDVALQPRFHMVFAQLLLKVDEEERAFPWIEKLAATYPRQAKDLGNEFLRVWAKNHDPNTDRNRTNQYMFFYGFEERANSIPLTRSKQERNLKDLGEWVERLRGLQVDLEPELLATAFTSAHSAAEVYRLETIQGIFGPLEKMEPALLAQLVEKMRANLATVWRDPAVQKDKKTNRKQQDIQAEVLRGYELAHATVNQAIDQHPESWELWLAKAEIEHDENDFRSLNAKDPEFSKRRQAAFKTFQKAAAQYAEAVDGLELEKESDRVFELWFYAALGAVDLKAIGTDSQLAADQIPLIRAAISGLPGERSKRHMAMFANALTTRTSNASPAVKFRYVREGLAIVGDNEMAREAQQVYAYYTDLVTEIQLRTSVDGSDRVGNAKPFGLRVDIRHTKEIERESGGFSKYLQNQNTANFAYNYGRPLEDYRDKFEEAARAALQEHFEVLSVTFNDPQARSRAEPEYGWRRTPYAYLLLKAKGPQIDRVPPLELDLDFLDTSGYAVVPVIAAPVLIDSGDADGDERPWTKLGLTQTLDERQSKDGKLILEVKATALGLVPALESLVDLAPEGFDVAKRDDHGVSVVKFDDDGSAMVTERTWTIAFKPKAGLAKLPDSFTFAKPKVETATDERFRYVDADLEAVAATIPLEHIYGKTRTNPLWWWIPIGLAVAGGAFVTWRRMRPQQAVDTKRFRVPDPLTPFTVLGLLRDIENKNGLKHDEQREIDAEIERLELHYFGETAGDAPDLERIAVRWVSRAS